MEKTNFLTEKEKAKLSRDNSIRADFEKLQTENPLVSKHRLHMFLADKYGINHNTIYHILR